MATLKMVRVDYRLIHGQIVAKWIKFHPVDRLVLVDGALAKDPFMADIYRMSASGKAVDICGLEDLQTTLDAKNDNVMLIFKDVASIYDAWKAGMSFPEINVGAVQSAPGRKSVIQGVALSAEEVAKLKEIRDAGVNIFLQPIPESSATSLASIEGKVK